MEEKRINKIIEIFKKAGIRIESGAQFSARGQIAQLLNAAEMIIEGCAVISEDVAEWQGVKGSVYENLPITIANEIRAQPSV